MFLLMKGIFRCNYSFLDINYVFNDKEELLR